MPLQKAVQRRLTQREVALALLELDDLRQRLAHQREERLDAAHVREGHHVRVRARAFQNPVDDGGLPAEELI